MTEQQHLITPPIKLFKQWEDDILTERDNVDYVLACAWRDGFRVGANQELEACCDWFQEFYKTESWVTHDLKHFRNARRPKPPSLKKQALQALEEERADMSLVNYKTIKSILEQLEEGVTSQ